MIAIICGSRTIDDYKAVREGIERTPWADEIRIVSHGDAPGVDTLAAQWAEERNLVVQDFPIYAYAEDSDAAEHKAALRRSQAMLEDAAYQCGRDAVCIAIWDGESSGTMDMVRRARKAGLPVSVYEPKKEERQADLFGGDQ